MSGKLDGPGASCCARAALTYHLIILSYQGSWTRGKLLCPGCGARLGGFDFVTRATEPVYLVRSKAGDTLQKIACNRFFRLKRAVK